MSFATRRRLMFTTLSLAYMLIYLQGVTMTVFAKDLMRDMNLTSAGMGMLGSSYLYTYAAVQLISGLLAARFGPRRTLSGLYLISGVGGLLFATSASLPVAVLGRAMSGMGLAGTMTSSFTLFGRWYTRTDYAKICAYFFAIGGSGALLGTVVATHLNAIWGWRVVFAGIAALTLLYSLSLVLIVRNWPPADALPFGDEDGIAQGEVTLNMLWQGTKEVARNGDFWRLVVWFLCMPGIYFSFIGLWAVPYLKDVYLMSDAEAGFLTSLPTFGFLIGAPVASWLSSAVWRSYKLTVGASGAIAAAVMGYLVLHIDGIGMTGMTALMLVLGMALNSPGACAYASARNLFGTRMVGITGGVYGCCSFLGGALVQVLCGELLYHAQSDGWSTASSYVLMLSPMVALGCIAAVAGFTLSPASDSGLGQAEADGRE